MSTTTTVDPVTAAYAALIQALGAAAAATNDTAEFERIAGFRRAATQQRDRYADGVPSHTVPQRKARAEGAASAVMA